MYAENEEIQWYIDNGCSKRMAGDQRKFINVNKEKSSVTFGNNVPTKIIGKGTINLGNERTKKENVSLIEGLKNNLLSFS